MNPINLRTTVLAAIFAVPVATLPAGAQRVLDLPVRTGVGADALATGPVAVFWNAGSIGIPAGRGEAVVLDTRGPTPTGLDGLGVAGVYRLDARTAIAGGFQHAGIDDIEYTTTSPLPEDGAAPFDVSENTFTLGAFRQLNGRLSAGAVVRYTRGAEIISGDGVFAVGAGLRHVLGLPAGFRSALAAGAFVDGSGTDWFAGAALERPLGPSGEWMMGAQWGTRGTPRFEGLEHRLAVSGEWRERVGMGLGIAIEPGPEGRTIEPAGSVSLTISRYVIGVVRENLPNDLGAIHEFRFSVMF